MALLRINEHRMITIVGLILIVATTVFFIMTLNPLEIEERMVATSMHLLTISLVLILTGFFVEVICRLNIEKKRLAETTKLIEQKLISRGQMFSEREESEIRDLIKRKKGKKKKVIKR